MEKGKIRGIIFIITLVVLSLLVFLSPALAIPQYSDITEDPSSPVMFTQGTTTELLSRWTNDIDIVILEFDGINTTAGFNSLTGDYFTLSGAINPTSNQFIVRNNSFCYNGQTAVTLNAHLIGQIFITDKKMHIYGADIYWFTLGARPDNTTSGRCEIRTRSDNEILAYTQNITWNWETMGKPYSCFFDEGIELEANVEYIYVIRDLNQSNHVSIQGKNQASCGDGGVENLNFTTIRWCSAPNTTTEFCGLSANNDIQMRYYTTDIIYEWFANDTSNNWNTSGEYIYTVYPWEIIRSPNENVMWAGLISLIMASLVLTTISIFKKRRKGF